MLKLEALHNRSVDEAEKNHRNRKRTSRAFLEQENPLYNSIWDALRSREDITSLPEIESLRSIRKERGSTKGLLKLRVNSIQSILEAESSFLKDLTPTQEQNRRCLVLFKTQTDPLGNPEDFKALIGSTYEPGQYAVLTRGTSEMAQQSLNIGGLWTDTDQLSGKSFTKQEEKLFYIWYCRSQRCLRPLEQSLTNSYLSRNI